MSQTNRTLPKIFFMHIAKTGGSSLNNFFKHFYPLEKFVDHYEGQLGSKNIINDSYDFISGHISIRRIISSLDKANYFKITVFREPIDQLVSHINWVSSISNEPNSEFFLSHPPKIREFSQALRSVDYNKIQTVEYFFDNISHDIKFLFDNCQTRYLLTKVGTPILSLSHLQEAIDTLGFFDRFCTLEDIELMKDSIIRDLFFNKIEGAEIATRVNVNPSKFVDRSTIMNSNILQEFCKFDMIIYQIVKSLSRRLFYQEKEISKIQ